MAEAEAEDPEAMAELRLLEDRYRLASDLISRRRSLRMTQQQLAAASGIRQSEISRIEQATAIQRSRQSAPSRARSVRSCG